MTRTLRDYYDVLGVGREADAERIKRAFRARARRLHPDISSEPDAESQFVELVEAYEVLSNPRSRQLYDRIGLGRLGRTRPAAAPVPERIVATVTLEHWQAQAGAQVPLRYEVEERCAHCAGSGADPTVPQVECETCDGMGRLRQRIERDDVDFLQLHTCRDCGGSGRTAGAACAECEGAGRTSTQRELRLIVPAGVHDGDRLRVEGVDGHVAVEVLPKPAERRAVRYVAAIALIAAVALLVYVLVS